MGRITIPMEIRRTHHIGIGDPMEMFTDGSSVVLRKYQPETWSIDELRIALASAAKEAGKDPVEYLEKVRSRR